MAFSEEDGEEFVDDSGADETLAKTLDHGADLFGFLDERHRVFIGENACGQSNVELGAEFSDRAFRYGEETAELPITFALGTLGDVAWHGDTTPRHLVLEGV